MNQVQKLFTFLLITTGSINAAHAGGIISDVNTQTADLVFSSSGTATIKLTAKQGLTAGSYTAGQEIATGVATASAGTVAYRWTPNSGVISSADNVNKINKISGQNNKLNTITVALVPSNNIGSLYDGGNGWIVSSTKNTNNIDLSIQNYQQATISPDSYVLSVDAAVWGY